jgi:hypothetical protein
MAVDTNTHTSDLGSVVSNSSTISIDGASPFADLSDLTKAASPMNQPQRFKMGDIGYSGVNLFNGVSYEDTLRELNWPSSAKTYKEMASHSAINSCLSLYSNIISKVRWRVVPPNDATPKEKEEAKFIESCLGDMDNSFRDFIGDALSSNIYGFSIHEKTFKIRRKSTGSLYDDGRIGLKKLGLLNQESISRFLPGESNNEIIGVEQINTNSYGSTGTYNRLPLEKYIHIKVGRHRGDPFGKSPLRDAYLAWRYLTVIQEIEAAGVARDLQGLPVLEIPAQYMSADASPEQKLIYEGFKEVIRNIQNNTQSGIILPSATDPDTRAKLFSLTLLNGDGKKAFDTTKVKEFYQSQIYTALMADVLLLGQGSTGSFALGTLKNSLTGSCIESMLDNIVSEVNRDIIRQLYRLNGMDASRACRLDYQELQSSDLDSLSKMLQRAASTGLVEVDRQVLNVVRTAIGIDELPDDLPPQMDILSGNTSRSSDGMVTAGEGTSTSVSGKDTSSNNLDNAG